MEAKPKLMKSYLENALAVVFGAITWFISGAWLHFDYHSLLQIGWTDVFIALFKLIQVGMGGIIGMLSGLFAKKYIWPPVDKQYKKFLSNKKRKQ